MHRAGSDDHSGAISFGLPRSTQHVTVRRPTLTRSSPPRLKAILSQRQRILRLLVLLAYAMTAAAQSARSASSAGTPGAQPPAARVIELKAPDGTSLKASYFAAAQPGPGVLLFHQTNRTRKAWDAVAAQLAASGINTLTLDIRGYGESGGKAHDTLTDKEIAAARESWRGDIESAWRFLVSQPGVKRDVIGVGGAGYDGVDNSVQTARQHPGDVKSLVLLSGETFLPGLLFLRQSSQLPGLFVVADDDERRDRDIQAQPSRLPRVGRREHGSRRRVSGRRTEGSGTAVRGKGSGPPQFECAGVVVVQFGAEARSDSARRGAGARAARCPRLIGAGPRYWGPTPQLPGVRRHSRPFRHTRGS